MINKFFNYLDKKSSYKLFKKYKNSIETIYNIDNNKFKDNELLEYFKKEDSKEKRLAIIKEVMKRAIGIDLYKEQIGAVLAMLDNYVLDMKTGEGKTFVIGVYNVFKHFEDRIIYVATATDYLAERDSKLLEPFYNFFNIESTYIINSDRVHDKRDIIKDKYNKKIVYSTYRGFITDYLQSNLGKSKEDYFQNINDFLVIDEIDSILIDEATESVYLSSFVKRSLDNYISIMNLVKNELREDQHFIIDREKNLIELTESGIERIENKLSIENLYSNEHIKLVPIIEQSIRALYMVENGREYIIEDGKIVLLDDYGRKNYSARFSEGLQQACEAKENVELTPMIEPSNKMSYQSYFNLFKNVVGCSGSIAIEQEELKSVYNLDVINIPTHKKVIRKDLDDVIYIDKKSKLNGLVNEIIDYHEVGQPILIICSDINEAKELSKKLEDKKLSYNYLDGTNSFKEGKIIEECGQYGKITIVANLAGRGVDIKTDSNVDKIGGLIVFGLSRQNSKRQDEQIRGRTGRQGKPGITKFFLSLEDKLILDFGNKKIKDIVSMLDIDDNKPIISNKISKMFDLAQKNVETIMKEFRLRGIEFDKVYDEQRKIVFKFRRDLIFNQLSIIDFLQKCKDTFYEDIYDKVFLIEDIYDVNGKKELNSKKALEKIFETQYNITLELDRIDNDVFQDETEFEKFLTSIINAILQAKFNKLNNEQIVEVVKVITIPILDYLWSRHISSLDLLQTGINWRSMTMKDPLSEFKKDGYYEFESFLKELRLSTFKGLLSIQIKVE